MFPNFTIRNHNVFIKMRKKSMLHCLSYSLPTLAFFLCGSDILGEVVRVEEAHYGQGLICAGYTAHPRPLSHPAAEARIVSV